MKEENIQKFERLYDESDETTSWLEILQDNFTFKEVFGRDPEPFTEKQAECFGIQKLEGPVGQSFELKYFYDQ